MLTRRTLVSAIPGIAAAGALAACSSTTTNGVTTITLNVAQANSWAQALLNATTLVAGLPGIVGTPPALAVMAVEPLISADLTAFNTAANGQIVLTYDRTTPAAAVTSLAADGQKLVSDVQAAIGNVASAQLSVAQEYLAAVKTIVSFFQAAVGSVAAAAPSGMTEARALAVLKVGK
jgi:hypothetical protein